MKKILIAIILISLFWVNPILAANTFSIDLELSSSQFLNITDANQTGLDLSTDFSFEFWAKFEQLPSTSGTTMAVMTKSRESVLNERTFYMSFGANDNLLVEYMNGSNQTLAQSVDAVVAGDVGNWVHYAVTVDISAATMTMYKNTVSIAVSYVAQAATTIENSTEDFRMGARRLEDGTVTQYFDGLLDDVRIWSDIRTSTEIEDNYQLELVGNEANLVAYWKLNNNANDETTNNNDLTANNNPVYSTSVPFTGAVDTCTCPSPAGNWNMNSGDNCYLTSECNIAGFTLYLHDTGGAGFHILDAGKLVVGRIQTTSSDWTLEQGGELYFRP